MAWEDPSHNTINARIFDANGNPDGAEISIAGDGDNLDPPAVDVNSRGEFVVAYASSTYDGDSYYTGYGIHARTFAPRGAPVGEFLLASQENYRHYIDALENPDVAYTKDDEFVVVWDNEAGSYFDGDYRYYIAGDGLGSGQVNGHAPRIAGSSSGEFIVAWDGAPNCVDFDTCDPAPDGVFMRLLASDFGVLPAPPVANAAENGTQGSAEVAMSPTGDSVVAWSSRTLGDPGEEGVDGDSDGVFARSFDCEGQPLEMLELQVNQYVTGAQAFPAVDIGDGGHVVVTWSSPMPDTGIVGLRGRRFLLEQSCEMWGDATHDYRVSPSDALAALLSSVGSFNFSLATCDANGDGEIKTSDALRILASAVGNPVPLLCP